MGIKGLFEFLRKKNFLKDAYGLVPLSNFKKISIDGHGWLVKNVSITRKEVLYSMKDPTKDIDYEVIDLKLIEKFVNMNIIFLENKITPVWVWDGTLKPAKADTLEKRKDDVIKKIETVKKLLEEINRQRKENFFVDNDLLNIYRNKLSEIHEINKVDLQKIKELTKKLGIPVFNAEGDGEQESANHVIHGHCDAVLSSDGDVLALGCHTLIKKISFERGLGAVGETYFLAKILKNMDFDYPMFREFCIMCGTDFNNNIPMIGPNKAYEHIKKYKTIENFCLNENKCIKCLKIDIVRPIFTLPDKDYEESYFTLGEIILKEEDVNKFIDNDVYKKFKKSIEKIKN